MLTLALSSWSFHRHLPFFGNGSWSPPREGDELSILDFPRLAASHGISEIEICQAHLASTDEEYLAQVSAAVSTAGCRVVNVPIDVGNLAESDPERREAELKQILLWIEAAYRLGSPCVRVNTGDPGEQDETAALAIVADGYRRLAAFCAERGMTVLLENHGGLSASPQAIMWLVRTVDALNFRLCPDFGNFAPDLREEGLRLMLPYAAVVHAKVHETDEQAAAQLRHDLDMVRASGYSGPLSIEFEGKSDEYEGVIWTRDRLVSYLKPSFRSSAKTVHQVAIVGGGMIARKHVQAWREAGAEVVAVADVNQQVLNAFGDTHGIPLRATDYHDLLDERVDIVDVCTPPWLHAPMTIDALQAGKHVLCEKPFALNAAEADAMADAAEASGTVLACRQGDTRLSWTAQTVRDVVQSGVLGDIYFLRLIGRSLYRPGIEYNPEAKWFLDRSKAGGGALYDWGVYDLELLFSIFGPLDVAEVTAMTFTGVDTPELDTPFDVEEHAAAMFKLRNGTSIFWERGWATHLPEEHNWQFYGTRAGLSFVPHSEVLLLPMDLRLTRYAPGSAVELDVPTNAVQGPNVYEDFLLAVDGERAPAVSGREAADMLRIVEQVYAAAGVPLLQAAPIG